MPLVQASATGLPLAFAAPTAKKPAARSSTCDHAGNRPSRASARTSGVERDPGEVQAPAIPQRASSSTKARRSRWLSLGFAKIASVPETVVLLHGFAGTRRSWDLVVGRLDRERYTPLALDIRGHGEAGGARPVDIEACVADVLAAAPPRFALCGYSMGGRVALRVALAAPERASALVLVATTAGIEDDGEREARRLADEALARDIEGMDVDGFVARWTSQAIFAGTPPAARAFWEADLRRNRPADLAAALRGLSGGVVEPVWDRLGELAMPAVVVAGERDAKFVALGERLVRALPAARELIVVPGAGHGLPREAPAAVAAAIARG